MVDKEESDISALIRRVEKLESNPYTKNFRRRNKSNNKSAQQLQCSHCLFLNKQLGASLDTRHHSAACGKRSVSVNLLESLDNLDSSLTADSSSSDLQEGDAKITQISSNNFLQISSETPTHAEPTDVLNSPHNNSLINVNCDSSKDSSLKTSVSDIIHPQYFVDTPPVLMATCSSL